MAGGGYHCPDEGVVFFHFEGEGDAFGGIGEVELTLIELRFQV